MSRRVSCFSRLTAKTEIRVCSELLVACRRAAENKWVQHEVCRTFRGQGYGYEHHSQADLVCYSLG